MEKKKSGLNIKITDDILKGVYSNSMVVTHTREEFVIDFINSFPPPGAIGEEFDPVNRALRPNTTLIESGRIALLAESGAASLPTSTLMLREEKGIILQQPRYPRYHRTGRA
jgi:hypothetical protein